MAIRGQTGESPTRRWSSKSIAPPKKTAYTLIQVVDEIENAMGELSITQKHAIFVTLAARFIVLTFQGNKATQDEYEKAIAQAFMELTGGKVEMESFGDEIKDRRHPPAGGEGEAPASPGGGEQN